MNAWTSVFTASADMDRRCYWAAGTSFLLLARALLRHADWSFWRAVPSWRPKQLSQFGLGHFGPWSIRSFWRTEM